MLRLAVLAALLAGATAAWAADTIEEKAALCGACHGLNGVPGDPTTPIIWGQNAGYLYLQFRDFQKGARKDDRMTPIAQGLVKEDALALAEYFAAKPWPNTGAPAASKADEAIAIVVNQVDRLHQLPPGTVPGRLVRASPRRARARLPLQNLDGLPQSHARQQPRHVRPDEHRYAGAARRDGQLSGGDVRRVPVAAVDDRS